MSKKEIKTKHHKTFEEIKQADESGNEYWSARDLYPILEYSSWKKFESVLKRAMIACDQSENDVQDHFALMDKMVSTGSGAKRQILDLHLTRYACYLIVQNGDPSKPVIANGQTYFAMQTRRQELADDEKFQQLPEDEQRLFLRNELKTHNKQLSAAASRAGVKEGSEFAVFQNHGYRGLYDGLTAQGIKKKKGLKKSHQILDFMGTTELAANLFRATQTQEKLKRDNVRGKEEANQTHFEVGAKVRQTIKDLGGTMPEDLPTPEKSVKQIKREQKKLKSGD